VSQGGSRRRILVVDDDQALRDSLHLVLDAEYEVVDAPTGRDALTILSRHHLDAVLLDLLLPEGDGFEVLEQVRALPRYVPVIVMSGLDYSGTAAAAMRLGAVDYITKPFDEAELLATLHESITSSSTRVMRTRRSCGQRLLLLVAVNLGRRATLSLLLQRSCHVESTGSVAEAIGRIPAVNPDIVIVESADEASRVVDRLRTVFPKGTILVMEAKGSSLRDACCESRQPTVGVKRASLVQLLQEIESKVVSTTRVPPLSDMTLRALEYLSEHYAEATVRAVGRSIGSAPYYLSSRFRRETGVRLTTYLAMLRVEIAKALLVETNETTDAIATRVGFHDASHLSRVFMACTGRRPGEYRSAQRHAGQDAS
jgi:YesN/AraC family two-component response regulator